MNETRIEIIVDKAINGLNDRTIKLRGNVNDIIISCK